MSKKSGKYEIQANNEMVRFGGYDNITKKLLENHRKLLRKIDDSILANGYDVQIGKLEMTTTKTENETIFTMEYPIKLVKKGKVMNKYYCPNCGREVERDSKKKNITSYCGKSDCYTVITKVESKPKKGTK